MIYVTGDTHGSIDIRKLNTKSFPEQKNLTKNDYVIIAGDYGGIWDDSAEEKYWLKWLNNRNFTTLFVDGNHENFDRLNAYDVEMWNGGKVHKISDSIIHLMRGQVFEIDGLKIFTMGGATSIDKKHRKEGVSWWKEELPTQEELSEALDNLTLHNFEVDYVITHTCSRRIKWQMNYYDTDILNSFFDFLEDELKYKHWYFGHFHEDSLFNKKHSCLYDKIVPIEYTRKGKNDE